MGRLHILGGILCLALGAGPALACPWHGPGAHAAWMGGTADFGTYDSSYPLLQPVGTQLGAPTGASMGGPTLVPVSPDRTTGSPPRATNGQQTAWSLEQARAMFLARHRILNAHGTQRATPATPEPKPRTAPRTR